MAGNKIASVRPSPLASIIGIVAGVVFLLFGVLVMSGSGDKAPGTYAPEPGGSEFTGVFLAVWVVFCVAIVAYNVKNLCSYSADERRRIPLTSEDVVEIEPDETAAMDFAGRLRKLEGLRRDGMISEDEFQRKRKEIMEEKW